VSVAEVANESKRPSDTDVTMGRSMELPP